MSFEQLIRRDLQRFSPYKSARSIKLQGDIWLNANESPYDDEKRLNRYPEPQPKKLKALLADFYEITEDKLLITRGSDEGIDLLIRLFCTYNEDEILALEPTFGMYRVSASLQGVACKTCKLIAEDDFKFDKHALLSSVTDKTKLVFLCSPNNPTGQIIPFEDITAIAKALQGQSVLVVDEAYIEFSNQASASTLIKDFDNVVVLRTLSKAMGLAGARVGSVIANKKLIFWLSSIIAPYPTPTPVANAAIEKLCSQAAKACYQQEIEELNKARDTLYTFLKSQPTVIKIWQSYGNFLLCQFKENVYQILLDQGIVIRDFSSSLDIENLVRISIGTPNENEKLMKTIREITKQNAAI